MSKIQKQETEKNFLLDSAKKNIKEDNMLIKAIGFQNFRRFKEETDLTLGDVNMFVGGNNAGKSTVVKALLLMANFLKETKVTNRSLFEKPKFYFNVPFVNIDTYNRAKCWEATDNEEISFYICIDQYDVTVRLFSGSDRNVPYADIKSIELYDAENDIQFTFFVGAGAVSIEFGIGAILDGKSKEDLSVDKDIIESTISELERYLKKLFDNGEFKNAQEIISTIASKKAQLESLKEEISKVSSQDTGKVIRMRLCQDHGTIGRNYISSLILGIVEYATVEDAESFTEDGKKNRKILSPYVEKFKNLANKFEKVVNCINIEYIYAHSASQKVLFSVKDNNDYLSQCVKEMYYQKVTALSSAGKVMKGWLRDFLNIESFKISPLSAKVKSTKNSKNEYTVGQGEGLAFAVKFNGGWRDLGDMGRGTIQLVILFMYLALILKKYEGTTEKPIVLVEEPEQNLHPAVQSKLADLFSDISNDYGGIKFVIETHSEYMIRRVQVLMAKLFKNVPVENATMQVFYFPASGAPYNMGYQRNGKFCKSFDSGFFNVADDASIELFDMED